MSISGGPDIITDSLTICVDAGNSKSYPGSGTDWYDLTKKYDVVFNNLPTYNDLGPASFFSFNGTSNRSYVKTLNYGNGSYIYEMSVFAWIKTTFNTGTYNTWDNSNWSILDFDRSDVFTFAMNGKGQILMSGDPSNNGGIAAATGGSAAYFDILGTAQCNDGVFHYIGYTYSVANQEIVMYVDGAVDKTFTANGSLGYLGAGVTRYGIIGDGSEATSEGGSGNNIFMQADLAALHFYDGKALTSDEVLENYNASKGRFL